MTAAPEPLARLAQHIERRITELALEYAEVCRRAEISDETLMKIRKGLTARGSTYRKLERALEWKQGGIAEVLAGGEAAPIQPPGGHPAPGNPALDRELELASRLMAAQVRELGLTPDEAEEAWRRATRRVAASHGVADPSEPQPESPRRHQVS